MFYRMTYRVLAVTAVIGCATLLALAADKHEGKVVEASKGKLVMTDMDGTNQHSLTVAASAKITRDGKTAKLDDLKKGDTVAVTLGEEAGKQVAKELAARSSKDKTGIEIQTDTIRFKKDKDGIEIKKVKDKDGIDSQSSMASARASKLISAAVMNEENESLGKIEEIVLNPHEGTVIYGVLSFGGFLGVGDKWFAIPWESLNLRYDNETKDKFHFVLNVDKEKLKKAPGFDKNHFPNFANPDWANEIQVYYKVGAK